MNVTLTGDSLPEPVGGCGDKLNLFALIETEQEIMRTHLTLQQFHLITSAHENNDAGCDVYIRR